MLESLPIASVGGFKVITVDYRQGPEHVFPAASEDVAAVYRELLKTYKPKQIGIYGCSAGGALSAQAAAWLPAPGCPGRRGRDFRRGRSPVRFRRIRLDRRQYRRLASRPRRPAPRRSRADPLLFQGGGHERSDVSPALNPAVAAKFPPTLVITGTRAMDMSPAIVTHSNLLDAGVDSNLIVQEGMGHCYIYQAGLPEAQVAYRQIVKFFRKNLG